MGQRLAFITIEQHNGAGFGLLFAHQTQTDARDLGCDLTPLQRVAPPPPTGLFLRNALDNCALLMLTPARVAISARGRGIVQLCRSATGSSSRGRATRRVAS